MFLIRWPGHIYFYFTQQQQHIIMHNCVHHDFWYFLLDRGHREVAVMIFLQQFTNEFFFPLFRTSIVGVFRAPLDPRPSPSPCRGIPQAEPWRNYRGRKRIIFFCRSKKYFCKILRQRWRYLLCTFAPFPPRPSCVPYPRI